VRLVGLEVLVLLLFGNFVKEFTMNVFEILSTKYETEWFQEKMSFKDENDGLGIVIDKWDMPIPKPTLDEIMSYEAEMQPIFALNQLKASILVLVEELINKTAKSKNYGDALACASYANSTVTQWANEAQTFIAWRDALWVYCLSEFAKAKNGERDIVSAEEFITELPLISW
jgi:uncharacterized membrane protein YgcG